MLSTEQPAGWAYEVLPAKNSLTTADAELVEDAFERRLSELAATDHAPEVTDCNQETSRPQAEYLSFGYRRGPETLGSQPADGKSPSLKLSANAYSASLITN
jgi:hypothetical protein